MIDIQSVQHENLEESEMGALHAIHLNENALAAVRARMGTGPSLEDCTDCGESIPEDRRLAVQGCLRCIHCQTIFERKM
jgi:phage/conjugal plasmid C-4 type zinc finger TraR family protein